ncbi:major facilitator superfamily transporter [Eremomyces bilateralis CBS 781.70]|uniref:Major facilitator superfamily transporter n=1 Tax=Eremomyces bilateralis CBS 781.70 TaxID=1392243 RepID=A0A6G1G6J5_9PEZI|nr:major facilitator superfamily transporter [Eremomyces bilateralis CBS 781.70]KAF1813459.1 major facilitator superfamily transporter [Eremomyces bilateralis CBS 781.70]
MGSAIILPALALIADDLGATPTVTNLSVALYMLSMSIFPLWWSSFSEQLGRRSVLIFSFFLFAVFALLSAVSTNIAMLIVMRVLSGGAAASVQAVGAGGIADIWEPKERGKAMGIFYLGPLCGPLLAPIFGGAMAETQGWRSTQWFLFAFGVATTILLTFGLPETLPRSSILPVRTTKSNSAPRVEPLTKISTTKSVHLKTKRFLGFFRRSIIDPLSIILLLRFPAVAITVYYASITFGSLYFLNISVSSSFSHAPYNFSTLIVGLLYIPSSLGYFLTSVFGGRWLDYVMIREAKKRGTVDERGKLLLSPVDRMQENAWISAILFPGALLWYGWTVENGIHWIVPMIGNFFFGMGSMIVFAMSATMLTEFLPGRASNGVAVNNFVRNIFSCVGALIAEPLIGAIGNGWLCTILSLVAVISGSFVILTMKKYGEAWRQKMTEQLELRDTED